jgi:predicted nucleotidyltransferase
MIPEIVERRDEIQALCRQYGVIRLDLFGSAATGAFNEETSDLDFVATFVDTQKPGYADRFLDFAEALESLLGRPVDLVTDRSIRNPYFREEVEATRQPIYRAHDAPAAA